MKRAAFFTAILIAIICITSVAGADVTIPNTFSPDTPAIAASVNANFAYLGSVMPAIANASASYSYFYTVGVVHSLASRTINAPTAGYVLTMIAPYVCAYHDSTSYTGIQVAVNDVPDQMHSATAGARLYLGTDVESGTFCQTMSWSGVFQVSAGANTFYAVGMWENGNGSSAVIKASQLNLLFIPAAGGTVTPLGSEIIPLGVDPGGNFDPATPD